MWCFSEWSAYHWFISGYPSRVGDQVNIPLPVPVKIELKIGDDGVRALTDFAERTGSAVAGYCASALDMIIPQRRRWAFNNYARLVDHYDEENHKRKEAGKRPIAPRFAHPAFQVIGDEDDTRVSISSHNIRPFLGRVLDTGCYQNPSSTHCIKNRCFRDIAILWIEPDCC